MLESGPLSEESFRGFSQQVVPFLHVTTKVEGDEHQELLQQKGGRGWPTLLFLDAEGEVLAEPADRSVAGFEATADALQTVQRLQGKPEAERTAEDEVELFLARVALGKVELAEALEIQKTLQATGAEAERVEQALIELEIRDQLADLRSQEQANEAFAHLASMAAAGRVPKGSGLPVARFWSAVSEHAIASGDAALFERCLAGMKEALGDDERYAQVYEAMEAKLAELKARSPDKGGQTPPEKPDKQDKSDQQD